MSWCSLRKQHTAVKYCINAVETVDLRAGGAEILESISGEQSRKEMKTNSGRHMDQMIRTQDNNPLVLYAAFISFLLFSVFSVIILRRLSEAVFSLKEL